MRVAIFDFDGTLYEDETFQLLMDHLEENPDYQENFKTFYRWMMPRYVGYKARVYPEARMKERSMQGYLNALGDMTENELIDFFKEVAQKMKHRFNPDILQKLLDHHRDGLYIMVISGTYRPLLDIALDKMPIDVLIGSEVPIRHNKLDKTEHIRHISGTRKNEQIHKALEGFDVNWEESYAYADSFSDLPVLELVGHPVAVQPEERLETVAKKRDWKIIT